MDYRSVPQLPFELRQGDTIVRSGTVPGDRSIPSMPVTPGRYALKLQGPAGSLDGQPTGTTVKATFDTAAADRNPPTLSHFRVLAGGKPSKAFCIGERAEIRFRVTDDVSLRHVQLKFRLGAQGLWLPWLLQRDGADLVARLPLGSWLFPDLCGGGQPLQGLPITVKIEATDTQGNTLETEMTPAYARTFPRSHAAPLRIDTA
jgi:hypothetical protein